ncbi:MAG: pentapeptide repeat-containing protein [Bacteroidales bacterium]|nr:pentapeptide repeat-containing protein [Bacteroidales bacterium]
MTTSETNNLLAKESIRLMIIGEKIKNINFNQITLGEEYDDCIFSNCDFSGMIIDNTIFEDCIFDSCNFSLAKIEASLRDVYFKECKMTGTNFTKLKSFSSFSFEKSNLEYATFMRAKLRKTKFTDTSLIEVDFSQTDLTMSVLKNCDLSRALFSNTNLEKADLSTSYNFVIDPNNNKIKKAIFSKEGLIGLVLSFGIRIID